jgi:hypothetical protein
VEKIYKASKMSFLCEKQGVCFSLAILRITWGSGLLNKFVFIFEKSLDILTPDAYIKKGILMCG